MLPPSGLRPTVLRTIVTNLYDSIAVGRRPDGGAQETTFSNPGLKAGVRGKSSSE